MLMTDVPTYTDEDRADKLPAEPPVEAGFKADHLVNVVHQTVDTCERTRNPLGQYNCAEGGAVS